MKALYYPALTIGALLLVGCASQSTVYYTLATPQSAPALSEADRQSNTPYIVKRVTVPADVDDTTLIVRQSNDQLMVLRNDKWTASLGEVLHNALSQSLTQAVGTPPLQGVMQDSATSASDTNRIIVDVQQFEMQPARQSSLAAVWRVNFADKNQPSLTCYSVLSMPAQPGVAPLVAAQQQNVTALAQQMAYVLEKKQADKADKDTNCQLGV